MSDLPDFFEVEAPAPMEKFQVAHIHPDNVELIDGDNRNARKLTKQQLGTLNKKRADLKRQLAQSGYEKLRSRLEELKIRWYDLKIDLHNLMEQGSPTDQLLTIKRQMVRINQTVKKLLAKMEAGKPIAAQLRGLDRRLDEHRAAIANDRLYLQLQRDMAKEVRIFGAIIVDVWNRLGYCYDYTLKNKHKRDMVRFEKVIATEDELQYKIKISTLNLLGTTRHHLPNGVRGWDLVKPETLIELTMSTERNVRSPHIEDNAPFENGAWLVVERMGLTDGLFNYIALQQLLKRYQQHRHHQIPLPMGVRKGRIINWVYLTQHPHFLVNGQTGMGKSNVFAVMLSTLIQYHSPAEVRLVLVDLKEGAEFLRFQGLPHCLGNIITEVADVEIILGRLEALRKYRMQKIRAIATDIDAYNALVPQDKRLARIVVVFDEYQAINARGELTHRINNLTNQLATKARAAGIHLIIGTQSPYSDVVPKETKANITCVLTGRQRTLSSSITTMGNKGATELPNIPGRFYCDDGRDVFQVQIPHARLEDIAAAIEAAKDWPAPPPLDMPTDEQVADVVDIPSEFGENDFIQVALTQCDGVIAPRRVWKLIDGEVGANKLEVMSKKIIQRGQVEHDGVKYDLKKYRSGYQLVAVQDHKNTESSPYIEGEPVMDQEHELKEAS